MRRQLDGSFMKYEPGREGDFVSVTVPLDYRPKYPAGQPKEAASKGGRSSVRTGNQLRAASVRAAAMAAKATGR